MNFCTHTSFMRLERPCEFKNQQAGSRLYYYDPRANEMTVTDCKLL